MEEKSELERFIIEKIEEVLPGRDKEALEKIAEDIMELTEGLEEQQKLRKIIFGELVFITEESSNLTIEISQEIAEKIAEEKR